LTFIGITNVATNQTVYSTSGPNTLTSATVAANTLAPGTQYDLDIVYSDRVSTMNAGFGTATAFTGYDLRTDLLFTTAAAVPEPSIPLLTAAGIGLALAARAARRHLTPGR
jgi:hypothetical protein